MCLEKKKCSIQGHPNDPKENLYKRTNGPGPKYTQIVNVHDSSHVAGVA